jgi:hypothetical protein
LFWSRFGFVSRGAPENEPFVITGHGFRINGIGPQIQLGPEVITPQGFTDTTIQAELPAAPPNAYRRGQRR